MPELLGDGAGFAVGIMLLPVGGLLYLARQIVAEYRALPVVLLAEGIEE